MYASDLVELFLQVTGTKRADLSARGDAAQLSVFICWGAGQPLMALARKKAMGITHKEARNLLSAAKERAQSDVNFDERARATSQAMAERALYLEELKTKAKRRVEQEQAPAGRVPSVATATRWSPR